MMQTLPLFNDLILDAPPTQSIKYIGSKLKLIPQVLELIKKGQRQNNPRRVLRHNPRLTSTRQTRLYRRICNDTAPWSKVFGTCYLLNTKPREAYQPLINHLNAVPPVDGWFTEHYGGHANGGCAIQTDGLKKPWQLPQHPQIRRDSTRNRNPQSQSSR